MSIKRRYAVLGAGRQGTCAAMDLLSLPDTGAVILIDNDTNALLASSDLIGQLAMKLLIEDITERLRLVRLDCSDAEAVADELDLFDAHACLSCLPYQLNRDLAAAIIRRGIHFNDLGGNTDVVLSQLELNQLAQDNACSVIPDCGLAPGLVNVIAMGIANRLRKPRVLIRCGGLPQDPGVDYRLTFSAAGLANEYSGEAKRIRDGVVVTDDALSSPCETSGRICIESMFPRAAELTGETYLDEAYTSGGTSTIPDEGWGLWEYSYRTLRYRGHFEFIRNLRDFGLLNDDAPMKGTHFTPRDAFIHLAERLWTRPIAPDMVLAHISVLGHHCSGFVAHSVSLYELEDPVTGFTAMERTTALGAAVVTQMQAKGMLPPGAYGPHFIQDTLEYIDMLRGRGLNIELSEGLREFLVSEDQIRMVVPGIPKK